MRQGAIITAAVATLAAPVGAQEPALSPSQSFELVQAVFVSEYCLQYVNQKQGDSLLQVERHAGPAERAGPAVSARHVDYRAYPWQQESVTGYCGSLTFTLPRAGGAGAYKQAAQTEGMLAVVAALAQQTVQGELPLVQAFRQLGEVANYYGSSIHQAQAEQPLAADGRPNQLTYTFNAPRPGRLPGPAASALTLELSRLTGELAMLRAARPVTP